MKKPFQAFAQEIKCTSGISHKMWSPSLCRREFLTQLHPATVWPLKNHLSSLGLSYKKGHGKRGGVQVGKLLNYQRPGADQGKVWGPSHPLMLNFSGFSAASRHCGMCDSPCVWIYILKLGNKEKESLLFIQINWFHPDKLSADRVSED